MREIYRLVEGKIVVDDKVEEFHFAQIKDDNGTIFAEVFLKRDHCLLLDLVWKDVKPNIEIIGFTHEATKVTLLKLELVEISQDHGLFATLVCQDRVILKKKSRFGQTESLKIFFIELEGLELVHAEKFESAISNGYYSIDLNAVTSFQISFDSNQFTAKLFNHPDININSKILEFNSFIEWELFHLHEPCFVSFLSFLNGAEVKIRTIYTGEYFSKNKLDSQQVEIRSFNKIKNQPVSDYLPILNKYRESKDQLDRMFSLFERFEEEDNLLDFRSLIYYLNRAHEIPSLEQKVFTLVIALEEIGSKFLESYPQTSSTIVPPSIFKNIKQSLLETMKSYKQEVNDTDKLNKLLSKIGDLNFQKVDTKEKFFRLFDHCLIRRTSSINELVVKRNQAIHEGNIGQNIDEKWDLYFRLDHVLRDIILNRIGYIGSKATRVDIYK